MLRATATAFVLFLILGGIYGIPAVSRVYAATTPTNCTSYFPCALIIVTVTDQNGVSYNGVQVQIWEQSGSIISIGTVQDGFYASGNLTSDAYYTVVISSNTSSETTTVYLGTQNYFLNLNLTRPAPPSLSVSDVTLVPAVPSPGSVFTSQITVESSSSSTAYNAFLSFNSSSPSGISVSGTGSTIPIGNLAGNSSASFNATFTVAATATVGDYQIPYRLTYNSVSGTAYTSVGAITVPVTRGVGPAVVVSSVVLSPATASPASTFAAELTVGTASSSAAYNAFISFNSSSPSGISVSGTGSTIPIGNLAGNSYASLNATFTVDATAVTGNYEIPYLLTYNDVHGVQYTSVGMFTVPVTRVLARPAVVVSSVVLSPATASPASTFTAKLTVESSSSSAAYNTFISFNSSSPSGISVSGTGSTIPIGNLAGNSSASFNATFTVAATANTGNYQIPYVISYSDVSGVTYNTIGAITVPVTRVLAKPVLVVSNAVFFPSIVSPGSTFVARITVGSSSSSAAYNAFLSFNSSSPLGIGVSGTGSTIPIGNLAGNSSASFNATFTVDATADIGDYQIPYLLTYSDAYGVQYTSVGTFTVPVTGTPSRPELVVSSITTNPSVVTPGITFGVTIVVNNSGTQVAYGSSFELTQPSSLVTIVGGSGQAALGLLKPGQSVAVEYQMYSDPNIQAQPVPIDFSLLYSDQFGDAFNSTGKLAITVSSTPNLLVGQFALSVNPLRPGLSSVLTMSVDNVGGDNAYNVALTLSGANFLAGNSSNYLGAIVSNGTSQASFYLTIANNTRPGSYTLNLKTSYNDVAGRTYTSLSNFTLTIEPYSPPSVTITNVLVDPPVLSPGTSGSITIFLKNSGTSEASNVVVQIDGGKGIISSTTFGLGTIPPGGQVTQVIGLNVVNLKAGPYELTFNVTFSDPIGNTYSSSIPLEITIYAATSLISTTGIAVIGVVVVVALIGVWYLRKSKKI